jgi:CRISPR-associated protein Cmr3
MKPHIITPRDPLIARDGRPFGIGSRARTLEFPLPSTISGAVRTRAGSNKDGIWSKTPEDVRSWEIRGPLLMSTNTEQLFASAPFDALMLEESQLYALAPIDLPKGTLVDLEGFKAVGLSQIVKGKPKGMPRYWNWQHFMSWLEGATNQTITPNELGILGPEIEYRTHVKIKSDTQIAENGMLFSTSGLEFIHSQKKYEAAEIKDLETIQQLALYIETNAEELHEHHQLWGLGGERRLSSWSTRKESLLPKVPPAILNAASKNHSCRVILLTPAYFINGWQPTYLLEKRHLLQHDIKLIAAASGHPQVISGWDYAHKEYKRNKLVYEKPKLVYGQPKPTRRLTPAGSVYYLKFDPLESKAAIANWVTQTWFQNISDETDDFAARKDGFGLAAIGTWQANKEVK